MMSRLQPDTSDVPMALQGYRMYIHEQEAMHRDLKSSSLGPTRLSGPIISAQWLNYIDGKEHVIHGGEPCGNPNKFLRPSSALHSEPYMGGCQNYGPFLGSLNNRCRIIIGPKTGTIILTTTHIALRARAEATRRKGRRRLGRNTRMS